MTEPKYIDAEKLKRHYAWWNDESKKIFDEIIDLQPDADVAEVRHGRWEDEVYTSWPLKIYGHKCSVCRAITPVSEGKNNYCPNCGAKMDGEEE